MPHSTPHSPVLFSYAFDMRGGGNPLQGNSIRAELADDNLAWVHLDARHLDTREWLTHEVPYLDSVILDALLADETRPRVIEHDIGMLLILRGVNLNDDEDPEDMVSLRLWIDPHRIISIRRRHVKAVRDIEQQLQENKGPKDAGDFLVALTYRLFERMEPVFTALDAATDEIEEEVMENPRTTERQAIIAIRKRAIMLRRYIVPQRDVIALLRTSQQAWITPLHRRQLQESYDRLLRYTEDLDAIRERAQVVKDELANALADKLNSNMYLLSVIAAIFLPLGFLTGLLGINVGGMPGADNPYAFWEVCVMMAAIIMVQIVWFKHKKWF